MRRWLLRIAVTAGVAVAAAVLIRHHLRTSPAAGSELRTFTYRGLQRTYVLHPGPAKTKTALVLMLHGRGGTGAGFERRVHFDALAEQAGAVVAYPDGIDARWNDGWQEVESDDVGFLAALADALVAEHRIDPSRVFVAGFSNGACMAHRLGCETERFAALAAVSGDFRSSLASGCATGRPISVVAFHGTADQVVPYGVQLRRTLDHWAARDGCDAGEQVPLPDADPADGTRVWVEAHASCRAGSEVDLYTIEGGGHTWPGETPMGTNPNGNVSHDLDASEVIWAFFAKHPAAFVAPVRQE